MKLKTTTCTKIFPVAELGEIDKYTIENVPISSINLMERAATAIFFKFVDLYKSKKIKIKVFAGAGNNGGDAVALARSLFEDGYFVELYFVTFSGKISEDTQLNIDRYTKLQGASYTEITKASMMPNLSPNDIIIDGLVGTGLRGPIEGEMAEVIRIINQAKAEIISLDIPSGLMGEDNCCGKSQHVIAAKRTITIEFSKLAFFFPENFKYIGYLHTVYIGLHPDIISKKGSPYRLINLSSASYLLKDIPPFAHKSQQGHALLIAGSKDMLGCVLLSGKAVMRTGAGLLSIQSLPEASSLIHTKLPEALIHNESRAHKYTAVGIGPGLGTNIDQKKQLEDQLNNTTLPMVLDADAINIIAQDPQMMSSVPPHSIFTPHIGEFNKLVGTYSNSCERLEAQRDFAKKHNIIIILKGKYTSVVNPQGEVFFNTTGNQGMATAGSGDVLTGIILSLLAQSYPAIEAATLGVFVHGLAGDKAAAEKGIHSLIASDIIDFLPQALKEITNYIRFV